MQDQQDYDGLSPLALTALRIVQWSVPAELVEPVSGDLLEEFQLQQLHNPNTAAFWLVKQCLSTVFHFAFNTQRSVFMFIFALVVFIGVVLMAFFFSSGADTYINVPSLIIVIPPAIFFARASASKTVFRQAFSCLLNTQLKAEVGMMDDHVKVFRVMGNTAMLMGVFGVVTGAIAMAQNIEPEMFASVFGPATAVLLLTLLYGIMVKTVCYLAELRLKAPIE